MFQESMMNYWQSVTRQKQENRKEMVYRRKSEKLKIFTEREIEIEIEGEDK